MSFPSWLPLGLGLRDFYERGVASKVSVITVDGAVTAYPAEMFFRTYEDFGIFDELACAHAYGHVMDIGAGAGCISLFLQDELGMEVTAVEIAEPAAEVMVKRGVLDVRCGDFFTIQEGQWDTLLLLMNGIGFVGKLEGLDRFLAHAKTLLAPGGQIIFDSSDLELADLDGKDYRGAGANYRGEVWYQLAYKGMKGAPYFWLYVDAITAKAHAEAAGFKFEVLEEAEEGYYLARLTIQGDAKATLRRIDK